MLSLYLQQPYTYILGGHFLSDESWSHMDRTIEDYELIIGVSGVIFMEVNGLMYEVKEGDILLLKPGERHYGYKLSQPGVSFYWFHFLLPEHLDTEEAESYGQIPRYAGCPNPSRVHILARQLLHAGSGGYRIRRAGDYFLTSLLIELAEQLQDAEEYSALDPHFPELLEWIRLHALSEDISVEQVAKHMGYNKDYLSRMFKKRFGFGLLAYIHRWKLDAAKEALTGTNLHIKEIAALVGIKDDKQFAKWFKRLAGVTPTSYRRAFRLTRLNKE